MQSEARPEKIMEKINRALKWSILGPQNFGLGGEVPGPLGPPLDPHLLNKIFQGTVCSLIESSSLLSRSTVRSECRS